MPRPKKTDRDLPPCVYRKHGAIWLVKNGKWTRLGDNVPDAMAEYAKALRRPSGGVAGLLERWFDDAKRTLAESTRKNYTSAKKRLADIFAEFEPHEVTARDVMAMMHHHREQAPMANMMRNVLIAAMDFAFLEGIIERNVARDVRPFKTKARGRYLTDTEFDAIYSKATSTLQSIMDLCYLTGQRISDIAKIRYADIGEEGIAFKQQKTKHRMVVAWSPELLAAVSKAKSLHTTVRGMTLLHTRTGSQFSYSTIRTLWDRACERAGIDDANIHDIRAKSATDANKQGIDSKALLGHASESSHKRYLRSKDTPVAAPVVPKKRGAA